MHSAGGWGYNYYSDEHRALLSRSFESIGQDHQPLCSDGLKLLNPVLPTVRIDLRD